MAGLTGQRSLFGHEPPRIDLDFRSVERVELEEGVWIEIARGWLAGHADLFEHLERTATWRAESRVMYEREVDVPRLTAMLAPDERPPEIERMRQALDRRYGTSFERVSLALYRDGEDSVAWHGDYVAREMDEALVATVSVGEPRRFFLKPTAGGASMSWSLGWGDLLVMGGTCQRTYRHAIPKVKRALGPRIAIMFRPIWEKPSGGPAGGEAP